jgi:hypothetical protein
MDHDGSHACDCRPHRRPGYGVLGYRSVNHPVLTESLKQVLSRISDIPGALDTLAYEKNRRIRGHQLVKSFIDGKGVGQLSHLQ